MKFQESLKRLEASEKQLMSVAFESASTVGAVVLDRLASISGARGATDLRQRLAALGRWVRADLADFEAELATLPRGARVVHHAAHHLLDLRGKHLRPLCVALASRFGDGFTPRARGLAVAVELVHTATLLHDDVVDLAERRRGQPAAAVVFGNAASIFAGDWLLVAALRRIAASGIDGLLDRMLAVIDEMIIAESLQLERRGRLVADRADYFRIVEARPPHCSAGRCLRAHAAPASPPSTWAHSSASARTSVSRSKRSTTSSTSRAVMVPARIRSRIC